MKDFTKTKKELFEKKLVAIFRGVPLEKSMKVAKALYDGGIRFFEICLDQSEPDPISGFEAQFKLVKAAVGEDAHIGAGTVLTVEDVERIAEIGGEMIVSPVTNISVIKRTKELGLLSTPGAQTPTEIESAYANGADIVKLYVVEDPHFVQMIKGPLGFIPTEITCNVSPETIPQFMKAGVKAFGTKAMLPDTLVAEDRYEEIRSRAEAFAAAAASN